MKSNIFKTFPDNNIKFGFLSDELKKYKNNINIVNKNGYKHAILTKNNTKDDKFLRRIFLVYAFPEWTYSFLGNNIINSELLNFHLKK